MNLPLNLNKNKSTQLPKKSKKMEFVLKTYLYPRKFQIPKLIHEYVRSMMSVDQYNQHLTQNQKQILENKIKDLTLGVECINIALFMHNALESKKPHKKKPLHHSYGLSAHS